MMDSIKRQTWEFWVSFSMAVFQLAGYVGYQFIPHHSVWITFIIFFFVLYWFREALQDWRSKENK
jgi:hypothetical protein